MHAPRMLAVDPVERVAGLAVVLSESEILRAGIRALAGPAGLEIAGELDVPDGLDAALRRTGAQIVLAAPVAPDCDAVYAALRRLPPSVRPLVLLPVASFRLRAGELRRRHRLDALPLDVDGAALAAALRELRSGASDAPALTVEEVVVGPGGALTVREQEVLRELARGGSNRAIAEALVVSQDTVKSHLRSVYRKLGVGTRAEAVALYVGELGGAH